MSHKILLIDESVMLRRITSNFLCSQPGRYEVVAVARGTEGFARACAGDINLILLDYQIAGFTNAELCRRLLAEPRTCKIPTVLLVGHGVQPPTLGLLPSNIIETLTKPIAPEQLIGLVNAIFGFTRVNFSLEGIRDSLHPAVNDRILDEPSAPTAGSARQRLLKKDESASASTPMSSKLDEQPPAYLTTGKVLLKGDTKAFSLSQLVRSIADRRVTGVLRLWTTAAEPTEIVFDQGSVLAVSTRDAGTFAAWATDALPPKVSQATLDEAVAEQRKSGTPFLLTLGTGGLLPKRQQSLCCAYSGRGISHGYGLCARAP